MSRQEELFDAARKGALDDVRNLLNEMGADEYRDYMAQTPLHAAARMNQEAVVECLLAAGASVCQRTIYGQTPLHLAATRGHTQIIRMLCAAGSDPNDVTDEGSTPLILAAYHNHPGAVSALLECGADASIRDTGYGGRGGEHGRTALDYAVEQGHRDVVALLKPKSRL